MNNSFCIENTMEDVTFQIDCYTESNPVNQSVMWSYNNMLQVDEMNITLDIHFANESGNSTLVIGPVSYSELTELFNHESNINNTLTINCNVVNMFGNDSESIQISKCGETLFRILLQILQA